MRDLVNGVAFRAALPYASSTADRTGSVIDLQGYDAATIVVNIGAVTTGSTTNYFTYDLFHGDQANLSDGVTVPAAERIGAAVAVNSTSFADKPAAAFGYLGNKRYIQVRETETGTAQIIAGATAVLGYANRQKVTTLA